MKPKTTFDELQLIKKMAEGDMNSFDAIYWKYYKAVYGNILKLVQDDASSEDILQDVFLSLWENREKIDAERSLAGWLFVTSYNRSMTFLKRRLREKMTPVLLDEDSVEMTIGQPLAEIRLSELEKAISTLSPQKQKVFYMCKLKGLSYAETAALMKISRHTVKEYLTAAFRSIKDQMMKSPSIGLVAGFFLRFFS
jgi:RNA polymerase sigma-70 factor (ECF subfamily)